MEEKRREAVKIRGLGFRGLGFRPWTLYSSMIVASIFRNPYLTPSQRTARDALAFKRPGPKTTINRDQGYIGIAGMNKWNRLKSI